MKAAAASYGTVEFSGARKSLLPHAPQIGAPARTIVRQSMHSLSSMR
jgi:hypothetical protein